MYTNIIKRFLRIYHYFLIGIICFIIGVGITANVISNNSGSVEVVVKEPAISNNCWTYLNQIVERGDNAL